MSQAFAASSSHSKPQLDEEEYIKYLMFLSEAVHATVEETDESVSVPVLSHLICRAKDATIRPYYKRGQGASLGFLPEGQLPPISQIRQTCAKLPYLEATPVPNYARLS